MKATSKLAILESLDAMSSSQKRMVLKYIADLFRQEQPRNHRLRRQKAMEQIRGALHASEGLHAIQF